LLKVDAVLAKTSLIAHAKTSSPTDGFNEFSTSKGHDVLDKRDGLQTGLTVVLNTGANE